MSGFYIMALIIKDIFVLFYKLFFERLASPQSVIEMFKYKNVFLSKDIIL